jgi:hypothetical protein
MHPANNDGRFSHQQKVLHATCVSRVYVAEVAVSAVAHPARVSHRPFRLRNGVGPLLKLDSFCFEQGKILLHISSFLGFPPVYSEGVATLNPAL